MPVEKINLPGVGKKFIVEDDEKEIIVIIHNTGKREVHKKKKGDEHSEELFKLSDTQARELGAILEGSYFQPISEEHIETKLDQDHILEWIEVEDCSELAGKEVGELEDLGETEIVAIHRDDSTIVNLESNEQIKADDILIVLEPEGSHSDLCEKCQV